MSLVDPRVAKQAKVLVEHSTGVKKGDRVLILADFLAKPLVMEIYRLLIKKGAAEVRLQFDSYELAEIFFRNARDFQIRALPKIALAEIKEIDCWIAIKGEANLRGLTTLNSAKIARRVKATRPVEDIRVAHTRWVISEFPTEAQAQEADMSLTDYENFVFAAINDINWRQLRRKQEKLRKFVDRTKTMRIIGEQSDLTFSIAGRRAVNSAGEYNMPDGEVFTSIVEDSANGFITFSFPALYLGREFQNVRLEFKNGKVVKGSADKGANDLNKILDMDKGARYLGEFGIGNNFKIDRFTKNILFDEKIGGTIHLALGSGYKETLSKNVSALHWDMIKDLGDGGELWFDKRLVQKSGKWLINI